MNTTALPLQPRTCIASQGLAGGPADCDAVAAEPSVHCCEKHAKLLMVDDEPVNIKAVGKHLRLSGYENFLSITDPTLAMSVIHREQPDLVLLDICMPQISGLVLLRQIRNEPRYHHLPVVILTASSDPGMRREALEAGCTDFMTKPVDASELVLRVRNTLLGKAYYDHLARHADQLEVEVQRQAEALIVAKREAELRYYAGKSEIASEVLHNVGNALNSVNVGVSLVNYAIRNSGLPSLKRAVDLLGEHGHDLHYFLTDDERGRLLPSYLVDVTVSLLDERDKMGTELELVTKHLEHISAVVATQQKYAARCRVTEDVSLADLLNDVIEMLGSSTALRGIDIVRDCQEIPSVRTDRQQLLQVLLNLVKNAVESIKQAHQAATGRMTICCGCRSEELAFVEVFDNGAGIPSEVLAKIFSHGFTTKTDGHGFGLHSCANIIHELGGSIRAFSDGAGKGATFMIELPFQRMRK